MEFMKSGMVLGQQIDSTTAFIITKLGTFLSFSELTDIVDISFSILDYNPRLDLAINNAVDANPNSNPSIHVRVTLFLNPNYHGCHHQNSLPLRLRFDHGM
ncbi:ribose-5-phosphate isomerase 3 [Spatholobus suberectus]|nr:ribose-5-phosphate isomerase 3 [Spatholobus suberectus]